LEIHCICRAIRHDLEEAAIGPEDFSRETREPITSKSANIITDFTVIFDSNDSQ
jgi:hypothetical protein